MPGIADHAVVPEVFIRADDSRVVEALAVVDQGLAEFVVRVLEDFEDAAFERFFAGREDVVQHVSQLQAHSVFPQIPFKVGAAFMHKIIPVEEQGTKIVVGKFLEALMAAKDLLDLLLFLAGEEK